MFGKKKKYLTSAQPVKGHAADIWRNFCANRIALVAAVVLVAIIITSCCCDLIFDYQTDALGQNPLDRLNGPTAEHWFGTDNYGRDVFARVLYGSRYSLVFGFGCTFLSMIFGCLFGATAAYYGGWYDSLVMRILDALMCLPSMLMMLMIVAVMGRGLWPMVIAITISSVPGYTRIVRSVVLSITQQDFIEAARSCGSSDRFIVTRHILPNAIGPILVDCMMSIASTIMSAAGLSYIGMGVQPPIPEWGNMLSEAMKVMRTAPHLAIFPGVALVVTALCFNLVGDGLADAIDPKRRK